MNQFSVTAPPLAELPHPEASPATASATATGATNRALYRALPIRSHPLLVSGTALSRAGATRLAGPLNRSVRRMRLERGEDRAARRGRDGLAVAESPQCGDGLAHLLDVGVAAVA